MLVMFHSHLSVHDQFFRSVQVFELQYEDAFLEKSSCYLKLKDVDQSLQAAEVSLVLFG